MLPLATCMFHFHSLSTQMICYDHEKVSFSKIVGLISLHGIIKVEHITDVYDGEYFSISMYSFQIMNMDTKREVKGSKRKSYGTYQW